MKKIILTVILAFTALSFSACSDTDSSTKPEVSDAQSSVSESSLSSDGSDIQSDVNSSDEVYTTSSAASPLAINTWGLASKYSTKEHAYVNVPVRITSVTRGDDAEKIVKKFMDESSSYNYTEPDKNAEWAVADYEISLNGFPVDEGGTDCSITSFITGTDNDYIDYGDKKWSTTTLNIIDGKYYYEGVVKGQIAYQMITGRNDYIIVLGEYNETQAFFSENAVSS